MLLSRSLVKDILEYLVSKKSEQKSEQVYTGKASRVKEAIVSEMRNNASITTAQLMSILGLGKTTIMY